MANEGKTYEAVPIQNSGQIWMLVVSTLVIVIPTLLVVLRFVAQHKISRTSLNASDYFIVAALLFVIALCIVDFFMVLQGGFTFALSEVLVRFGPDALTTFFKCMAAWPLLWNCCVLTSKMSVLLMYTTLIPVKKMIIAVRCVAAFVIVYNFSGLMTGFLICRPYSKNYDWQGVIPGTCGDVKLYYEWLSAINVVSDVIILLLPLPFLWGLQLALRKKIVLVFMFSIGFLTCAVTIFRQTLLPGLDAADPTGTGLLAFLFSTVEIGVAVSLACVPFLRPLFKTSFDSKNRSDYHVKGSSHGFSNNGSKSHRSQGFNELNDDASDIQLQPVQGNPSNISVKVETKWDIESHGSEQETTPYGQYEAKAIGGHDAK